MKCKLITTASDMSKTAMLQKSLIKFGWDYHIIEHEWTGFGNKLIQTNNYLKANPDITHFFYSDSYDTIVLDTMDEALRRVKDFEGIQLSAEQACIPHPHKELLYPKHDSPFRFVNGGGWFCNSQLFQSYFKYNEPTVETVDQVWLTDRFLGCIPFTQGHKQLIHLDYNCNIFQTIAFCPEDYFILTEKVYNTLNKTFPIFVHVKGHTPMYKFYKLL